MREVTKPSFVIFCTDQQRADSLGCAGNERARTPHIDSLAARGTRFTRHRTPNQICCPSRGSLLTGLYPRHHGMTTNGRTMVEELPTLPGLLSDAGWDTHAVGKFIAAGPGIPAGQTCDALTSHVDILPTLLDRAGMDYAGITLDGCSLRPLFDGTAEGRSALYMEYHPRIREETYNHSILTRNRRLTLYPFEPSWGELFDLEADPGEHHNVFDEPGYKLERDRFVDRLNREFPGMAEAGEPLLAKW